MTLSDGVAWGTIIGGFAGFLSFGVVLYDKLTSRPKLITSVREATFSNLGLHPFSGEPRISFQARLEVGNVGSEATTITRIVLVLAGGRRLDSMTHERSGGFSFLVDDYNTRVCEKGIAFIESLKFNDAGMTSEADEIEGTLVLTLIGGSKHRQSVVFKKSKD